MAEPGNYPLFMMRVKLPDPAAYSSGPSGDTAYQDAFCLALFQCKPDGYEVIYPAANTKWPVDSEGFSWVPLRCTDEKNALAYWMKETALLRSALDKLRRAFREVENV